MLIHACTKKTGFRFRVTLVRVRSPVVLVCGGGADCGAIPGIQQMHTPATAVGGRGLQCMTDVALWPGVVEGICFLFII